MAIYGIGAYFGNDVSDQFLEHNIVGVGWGIESAPELHQYVRSLRVGISCTSRQHSVEAISRSRASV
jgi:hypothetical protein